MAEDYGIRPGVYNTEYFSGSACALYIGDIWVDEVTSISYQVSQSRRPLYGYASVLFDQLTKGTVIVQGQFSINFKEAGYLWLVLNKYKEKFPFAANGISSNTQVPPIRAASKDMKERGLTGEYISRNSIEDVLQGTLSLDEKNKSLASLAASLTGYESEARQIGDLANDKAEGIFEAFEDVVWGRGKNNDDLSLHRRVDDPILNPFDIYLAFGDFDGDNRRNHTVRKIENVSLLSTGQQIEANGLPIQEHYSFIAQNII